MTRQLNIAGKNSNEVYTLFYPNNLINFCKYDFSLFLEHCTDLCRLAARSGEYNVEDVYSIRNSISGCHKYYEQNMRGVFEKIVIDCWIEYLCKQSDVGTGALWQGFMRCRNDFERAIFSRLSDYRYNRAINEWTNLVKMQDYARTKTDFVYGVTLSGPQEAAARSNYFDLVFNVAANEQGFPLGEIASTSVFSMGRLPNSPFIMSNAAREIVRNQLGGIPYIEGGYRSKKNPDLTDKTAMDAFTAVKEFIPLKNDIMAKNIIRSITGTPQNVYMPCSFKAIIDLEIDMIAESGAVIQKCAGCGEYFLKDESYNYDYCDRVRKDGLTCLEYAEKNDQVVITGSFAASPAASAASERPSVIGASDDDDFEIIYVDKSVLTEKTDQLYKEMAARVNVDMTQRDFSNWYQKELRLKEKVILGEAGEKELDEFIELSRGDHFATKKQSEPIPPPAAEDEPPELTENGKAIKKFVFERVERSENAPQPPVKEQEPSAPARQSAERPQEPKAGSAATLSQSEQAAMEAVKRLFADKNAAQMPPPPAQYGYQQMQPYPYGQYPPQYQQPVYPYPAYGQAYPPPQQRAASRVIRGGTQAAQDYIPKSKTVVIPNDIQQKEPPAPSPEPEFVPEPDVKVFLPKGTTNLREGGSLFMSKQQAGYIEPSPYERMRDEYKRAAQDEPIEEVNVVGQMSVDDIEPAPRGAAASAISAYRSASLPQQQRRAERADFSQVLDGIKRDDGFLKDDIPVDSDGMPVSHKTKHVMNALFSPPKVSPFLKMSLEDDDE